MDCLYGTHFQTLMTDQTLIEIENIGFPLLGIKVDSQCRAHLCTPFTANTLLLSDFKPKINHSFLLYDAIPPCR